jgi:hypothetical protein
MQRKATVSFVIFCIVQVVNLLTVLFDFWLHFTGREMITYFVWGEPWWGIPLVAWQLLGAGALAYHLFFPVLCKPKNGSEKR